MAYIGVTTRAGKCAICKKTLSKGVKVYFDWSKSQGNHLAEISCFDALRASREIQPPRSKEVRSTERLDPPF